MCIHFQNIMVQNCFILLTCFYRWDFGFLFTSTARKKKNSHHVFRNKMLYMKKPLCKNLQILIVLFMVWYVSAAELENDLIEIY